MEIHATNTAGAATLDRPGNTVREVLADALRSPADSAHYRVQALTAAGVPDCQLIVERRATRPQSRVNAAVRHFELTPRQREVLELLVLGHTNRTISELLRCAERTVELHVSAMLEKTGSDSRSHLVARVWMLDEG